LNVVGRAVILTEVLAAKHFHSNAMGRKQFREKPT
jgi:hypothetical protein